MRDEGTLGGYLDRHERPPAFEGIDGKAYSVSVVLSDDPEPAGFGAALMFIRWSEQGDAPVGHVETDYLVFEATSAAANLGIENLSLSDIKAQLDEAIERAQKRSDW